MFSFVEDKVVEILVKYHLVEDSNSIEAVPEEVEVPEEVVEEEELVVVVEVKRNPSQKMN